MTPGRSPSSRAAAPTPWRPSRGSSPPGRRCLVVRNGFFSYRWSQILDTGSIAAATEVLTARPAADEPQAPWTPAPVDEVVEAIGRVRPEVVFAPHVETSSGMLLPDDYVRAVAAATHEAGGLFVLDCIASGALWVDMTALGVDVLISAPQKGWSGSPGAGFVMLGEAGREAVMATTSSSFAVDLQKWLTITEAYTQGLTPYHATMPTDTLTHNAELMRETVDAGLDTLRQAQVDLGTRSARCSPTAASRPSRRRSSRRRASWSSTPTTPTSRAARGSSRAASRSPPAYRSCAVSATTSRRSGSGCSASTSSATSTARSARLEEHLPD